MSNIPYKDSDFIFKKRGIRELDAAVLYYFKDVLDINTETQDGNVYKVPVYMATAERRFTSDNPELIDENGTLKKPFIRIRKVDVDRTNNGFYGSAADMETIQIVNKTYGKTNNIQNLHKARWKHVAEPPANIVHEIYTIPFPDFFVATYEVDIETVYISTETNIILETIFQSMDFRNSFKIPDAGTKTTRKDNKDSQGFFYVGFLDPSVRDESNLDDYTDQERNIKHVLSFRVGGVIFGNPANIPDYQSKDDGFIRMRKHYSSYKVRFNRTDESYTAETEEELARWFG